MPIDSWVLTKADIMKLRGQNDRADDPAQPHRDLDQHQDEDEGPLPVVVLDVLGLDGEGRHEHHQEEDVEEWEDVVRRAEVAPVLQLDE